MTRPHLDFDDSGSGLAPQQVWHHYRRYPYLLSRLALGAVVVALVYIGLQAVESVLFPVLVSLLLAYALDPAIDRLEARGWQRTTGILLFLVVGAVGVLVFLLFLYPTIAHLIGSVGERFPALIDLVRNDLLPWIERVSGQTLPASMSAVMDQYGESLRGQLPALAKRVSTFLAGLWTSGGSAAASLLNLVLVPVLTFYFLRDFDQMKAAAAEFIPVAHRAFLMDRLRKADEVIGAWIRGQLEVAVILGVLYAVGLGTVFWWMGAGLMTGVAVGMTSGLLNFIPYLGFLVGFILSFAIVLIDWAGPVPVVLTALVFIVVQALEGWVITPRIVGEKVGMSPVTIILVLLVGGELLGLLGVVLAIPVAGAVGVLLPDIIDWYKRSNFFTGQLDASEE
jgi:predicted PurR-regulated permease PerM